MDEKGQVLADSASPGTQSRQIPQGRNWHHGCQSLGGSWDVRGFGLMGSVSAGDEEQVLEIDGSDDGTTHIIPLYCHWKFSSIFSVCVQSL